MVPSPASIVTVPNADAVSWNADVREELHPPGTAAREASARLRIPRGSRHFIQSRTERWHHEVRLVQFDTMTMIIAHDVD